MVFPTQRQPVSGVLRSGSEKHCGKRPVSQGVCKCLGNGKNTTVEVFHHMVAICTSLANTHTQTHNDELNTECRNKEEETFAISLQIIPQSIGHCAPCRNKEFFFPIQTKTESRRHGRYYDDNVV